MPATRLIQCSTPVLTVAFELGWTEWKLASTTGRGLAPRIKTVAARDLAAVDRELAAAKVRFGLPADTPVRSVYEAGRDGFWLHRALLARNVDNLICDPASIEVNRRARRAKTDALDAAKLVALLVRHHEGERVWTVLRVPSPVEEDRRTLHRELEQLKDERTGHANRVRGLLAQHGLDDTLDATFATRLPTLRLWNGEPVPAELQLRLLRIYERWQKLHRQILDLESLRKRQVGTDTTPQVSRVRRLLGLAGLGFNGSWLLVYELFGWRQFRNRRELASHLGLTPTPYASGSSAREQGISKAGNARLRRMMVELAWCWLRHQPESALSRWYAERFARGSPRARKVGIVAVARKLAIALWRYVEQGELPAGAMEVSWQSKLKRKEPVAA